VVEVGEVGEGQVTSVADGATIVGIPAVAPSASGDSQGTVATAPPISTARRTPRAAPAAGRGAPQRRRWLPRIRHAGALAFVLVVLGLIGSAAYLALQSVYFIGTNSRGLVTLYQGLPYTLPGNLTLYSAQYVSGVSASTLSAERRHTLLDHSLRSEGDAGNLIRSLELEQLE
jgi:hypothetical protein